MYVCIFKVENKKGIFEGLGGNFTSPSKLSFAGGPNMKCILTILLELSSLLLYCIHVTSSTNIA